MFTMLRNRKEIENGYLKSKFRLPQKDASFKNTNKLTPIDLTKSKYSYFYENVDWKSFFKSF